MQDTTRRTAILAAAAGVVASLAFAALAAGSQSGPGSFAVEQWGAAAQGPNAVRLSVTTEGAIPSRPDGFIGSVKIAGFAWADLATGKAVVATIHPVAGRDSNQRPDSWHLHTVSLTGGTGDSDFCVVSIDSTPTAGINILGATLSAIVRRDSIPVGPSAIDVATGFIVTDDLACGSHLGVVLLT